MMTAEQASEKALNMQDLPGFMSVILDVEKFEPYFMKSGQYIEKGSECPIDGLGKRAKIESIFASVPVSEIRSPRVWILGEGNGKDSICFYDGRHRYCVLRDAGAKAIKVAMDFGSWMQAERLGIVSALDNNSKQIHIIG